MGEVEILISVRVDSSVKYHSLKIYILTSTEKTSRDSIWWAVLVGRYPRGFKLIFESSNYGASRDLSSRNKQIRGYS